MAGRRAKVPDAAQPDRGQPVLRRRSVHRARPARRPGAGYNAGASRTVHAHIVRWQWLSPAIVSIPLAIVAGRWSTTASDVLALSFYPFAMLTTVRPARRPLSAAWSHQSFDALIVGGAAFTAILFLWFQAPREPSLYRLLAPVAAVSLVLPIMRSKMFHLGRGNYGRGGP